MLLENIMRIASDKKISIAELERRASLNPRSIYKWDEAKPSYDKVMKVAEVLGCTVEELAGKEEE